MLRRSVCRADRLIIVESPNKTAKITSILQGAVPDWTFGDGRLSAAANRYGSANNGREGVAVMATVGHFMDTKDLLISRSDLVLPASAAAATTTVSTTASAAAPSDATAKKAPKKGGGAKNKKKGSAVDSALLDLPPLPDGAQLLSFVPDLRLRPDNTSMDPIVRYILANNNLNEVILASDPDREGELIAVHALRYLMKKTNLGKQQQQKGGGAHPILFSRAYIQSITEEGVVKAMRERRLQYCDFALAESASARHSMDRIFGWVGSTLMRRIDRSFVSIGRVQTPALILVREQEQKIEAAIEAHKAAFIIQGKFNILGGGGGGAGGNGSADEAPVYTRQVTFQIEHPASATAVGATKPASVPAAEGGAAAAASAAAAPSSQFTTKEEAEKWLAAQFGGGASAAAGGKKDAANKEEGSKQQQQRRLAMSIVKAPALSTGTQKPPVPHTMQSLLTAASNQLKLSSEDVTKCLQELFQSGLITYPRTDSTRLDEAFVASSLKDYIEKAYGKGSFVDYQSKEKEKGDAKKGDSDDGVAKQQKAKKKEKKEENVEDAHEALRPTSLDRHPADPAVLALFGIGTATPAVVAGGGGGGSSSSYSSSPRGNNLASHRSAFPVYKMIYQQTLAAFMAPAETETTTVSVGVRPEPEGGSAAASSSSPMLVAKLTATRLVRPGWRSARLGRDKAAVEEAMAKAKGGNIGGDGPAEGSDGADGADAEAAEGAAADSSAAISAFDLIHNLPKYLAATRGDNNKATGNKKTKKEEDSAVAASSVSFHASICDLRVAEKAVVLPKPFTEGSLIQSLKERGVGRPSTYPAILKTLFDRQYITRDGGQRLHTTPTGKGVVRAARNAFPTLVDIGFTASFERELNAISEYRLDRGEGAAEEKNEAEGGNNGKKAGSKKDNKEKSGLVPLTDKANPDLGEGANPLTCYTLSRLTYSLAGMVDGAVQRHLLMQSYRIADMKSLAAKSRELAASGAGAAAIGEKKGGDASAAAAATPSVGLAPEVAAALKTYGKTSLFERDPSFEAHRNQIAWRTNRIDLPKLLDMVDKGEFKVYAGGNSNNNSNGGNRGGNASQSALEVVSQLTLNLLSSSYMHRHLGIAVGSGAQLHMLGLDETKNPLFQCEADKDRLLSAIPPRPAAAVAASPVAVPRAPIASTTAAPAKVASASSLTTPPAAAATSAAASADGKKDTKEAKPKRSKKASVATATSEGTAAAPRSSSPTTAPATPPAAPVSSSPPVTAGTLPTDAPPKKAFDPMDFFRMGGIRR